MKNNFKVDLKRKLLVIEENGKFDVEDNEELTLDLPQTEDVIIAKCKCRTLDKEIPVGSICVFNRNFGSVSDKVVLLQLDHKEFRVKRCTETETEYIFTPNSTDSSLKPIVIDKNNTSVEIIGVLQNVYLK